MSATKHGSIEAAVMRVEDAPGSALIRRTALKTVFGGSPARRAVLRALGIGGALAALDTVLPLRSLEAMAEEKAKPEKTELSIGFIAITCATPLVLADKLGIFKENGLDVELVRTPGWAAVRERLSGGQYEASHVLTPLPLAMTMGIGGAPQPAALSLVQNTNGDSLVLAMRHKDRRDPKAWKGMSFGVPFDISMQNFLLRYFLAESGLDPDKDVSIKTVSPPEMVSNLKAGILDGFLAPDNAAQMAVHGGAGFIHMLSKEIWAGHPCCGFGVSAALVKEAPNTYLAIARSMFKSAAHASKAENRKQAAEIIADAKYLNLPVEVAQAVLTGEFDDGLGGHRSVADRIDFQPFPYHSMAVWMLTQMKRWGMVKGDANFKEIAEKVFLAVDAQKLLKEAGLEPPASTYGKHMIMGKSFEV
ncbi:MAG: CmpA/NrtA family ABC transporter substrate-binding protein [Acidobacteriota bacterium]